MKPSCPHCGTSEHVVRFWHGRTKLWACRKHFKVTSTKRKEASLAQRIMHKLPEPDTIPLGEILPNRAARRR